jgi:hypothetical protein
LRPLQNEKSRRRQNSNMSNDQLMLGVPFPENTTLSDMTFTD